MTIDAASSTRSQNHRAATNPPDVAPPIRGYYSNCVKVRSGVTIYVAGQLGVDSSGKLVGSGAAEQTEQALRNIDSILTANGATMRDVVKVTVYVIDISDLDVIAPVRMRYFPDQGPASVIVEISRLAFPDARVEIDAIASIEEERSEAG
jgi:2-iminobutanoate/2-iminopropanoate deaminase